MTSTARPTVATLTYKDGTTNPVRIFRGPDPTAPVSASDREALRPATAGSGQGLRGIAERVALFGGTVATGPRVGAGYRVHAHLPYTEI